jgi:hypothetical protein
MNIDPDILAVILGLITNGLTSLLSATGNNIGKLIIGKEFDEKWKLEKTSLLPILQTSISQLEEHIDLKGVKGEEIICLFLLSPEVEEIVRQIYSLQITMPSRLLCNEVSSRNRSASSRFRLIIVLCLPVYRLAEYRLLATKQAIPNQVQKPTARPKQRINNSVMRS